MDDVEIIITGVSTKGEVKVDSNRYIGSDKEDVRGQEEESSERDDRGENL